jgi:hypothetical protein
MALFRVIYFSENHFDFAGEYIDAELEAILRVSQANNQRDGITGVLIFDDLWFIQVLEGDRETVWNTVERIRCDERHHGITIVDARDVDVREFGTWSMALITKNANTASVFSEFGPNGRLHVRSMKLDAFLSTFRRSAGTVEAAFT